MPDQGETICSETRRTELSVSDMLVKAVVDSECLRRHTRARRRRTN